MAVLLRRAAALLVVAAVCADGASTFYSSDPNLGSARVVFQVTRPLLYRPCWSNCDGKIHPTQMSVALKSAPKERCSAAFGGGKRPKGHQTR
ncbi:Peptidyl-prolyl cis-trans isomerase CYP23 [Zea mays]|uniref:Peptidyl-prolyl cis-trans isomerase CYP23 n=1 Tax=Zea mays TaxID=4577 RepID=A0A1D6F7C6_MAIZE|nr:Peptidyl-prolyl cis-trans isomerase CYP23 [Zea mays]ONM27140.1 Peptidyl-prolyl cis-trans isomerase CYP23 [Zea mays]